jgi:LysM repeat protein
VSVELVGTSGPPGRLWHYLAPVALIVLIAAVVAVVLTIPGRSSAHHRVGAVAHSATHRLPPYWVVRANDTLSEISLKTGLTIDQLQAFNPQVDPNNLLPGTRLNLWEHPPVPRPPPPGPMFWTVRAGESYGSIADKTGINIDTLEALNPRIKPASLQPGERVRLRS